MDILILSAPGHQVWGQHFIQGNWVLYKQPNLKCATHDQEVAGPHITEANQKTTKPKTYILETFIPTITYPAKHLPLENTTGRYILNMWLLPPQLVLMPIKAKSNQLRSKNNDKLIRMGQHSGQNRDEMKKMKVPSKRESSGGFESEETLEACDNRGGGGSWKAYQREQISISSNATRTT